MHYKKKKNPQQHNLEVYWAEKHGNLYFLSTVAHHWRPSKTKVAVIVYLPLSLDLDNEALALKMPQAIQPNNEVVFTLAFKFE